jgi:hypothetical protein
MIATFNVIIRLPIINQQHVLIRGDENNIMGQAV